MDYKLRKLYEQMTSVQSSVQNSDQNKYKSLSLVYEREVLSPSVSSKPHEHAKQETSNSSNQLPSTQTNDSSQPSSIDAQTLEKLTWISGITDNNILNQLYAAYQEIKKNSFDLLNGVSISTGGAGSVNSEAVLSLDYLKSMIEKEESTCFITYAGTVGKIRNNLGVRIGEWSKANSTDELKIKNAITNLQTSKNKMVLRFLIIFALWEQLQTKIVFKAKLPAGIKAELQQVNAINKALGEKRLELIIADSTAPVPLNMNVYFNRAEKVPGTPKADIMFLDNGAPKFWLSFKEGEHAKEEGETPGFQQWGSLKKFYESDKEIKHLIDVFLTKCIISAPDSFDVFDLKEFQNNKNGWLNAIENHLQSTAPELLPASGLKGKQGILKDIESSTVVYITKSAVSMYADFMSEDAKNENSRNKYTPDIIKNIALKSIFGKDYKIGAKFGVDNVNAVLETPRAVQGKIIIDPSTSEPSRLELDPSSVGGHLLLNPNMPESSKYYPCLYLRRTQEERFLFNYTPTIEGESGEKTLILCGRALFYNLGRAAKEAKEKIPIFS